MVEGVNLPRQQRPGASIRSIDAGYLRTLGVELRAGRFLAEEDAGRPVAVVSSLTARRLWPQQDPLGKRFRSGPDDSPLIEVVGSRTASDPARPSATLRELIRELDPELAVTAIRTMDDIV